MSIKAFAVSLGFAIFAINVASCAQPARNQPIVKAAAVGSRFESLGRVTFHIGQPCTPQIMFDFRGDRSKSIVWLAVNAHEEKLLIDAAHKRRRVHVSGKWQRGKARACSYVSVIAVEVLKSFWQR